MLRMVSFGIALKSGTLILLLSVVIPVRTRRRVINYIPQGENEAITAPLNIILLNGTMEDILDTPKFRRRKADISLDPDVWGDALSAYEKQLSNRGLQVDPHGAPIGYMKPGLFSPWAIPVVDERDHTHHTHTSRPVGGRAKEKPTYLPAHNNINPILWDGSSTEMNVFEKFLRNSVLMTQADLYGKCGQPHPHGKPCYGVPSGCVEEERCRLIVTFSFDDTAREYVTVNLAGESSRNGFVAFAFSHDRFLGEDVVIYCINVANVVDPRIALYLSFNREHRSYMQKDRFFYRANFVPNFGYSKSGMMACSFNLSTTAYLDDGSGIDVYGEPLHLMLSFGHYIDTLPVNHTDFGSLKESHLFQFTNYPVILADALHTPEIIYPRSRIHILVHVISSVIAYVFLMPSGMIIAKYGREVYGYPKRIGRFLMPMWLFVHLLTNLISLPLVIISIISILIELDFTWRSYDFLPVMHSVFGMAAVILVPINFAGGFIFKCGVILPRNDESTNTMNLLTWVHWLFGTLTYFLSIFCIVVSGSMTRAQAPCFVEYFGYLHLILHVATHLVLSCDTYGIVKEVDKTHMCQRVVIGPMISWRRQDSPMWAFKSHEEFHEMPLWRRRRRAVHFYSIVSFLCAFTICVLMLLPVVLCRK